MVDQFEVKVSVPMELGVPIGNIIDEIPCDDVYHEILLYLIAMADDTGYVQGRSFQLATLLPHRTEADIKAVLHELYCKKFISRDNLQNVRVTADITVYQIYEKGISNLPNEDRPTVRLHFVIKDDPFFHRVEKDVIAVKTLSEAKTAASKNAGSAISSLYNSRGNSFTDPILCLLKTGYSNCLDNTNPNLKYLVKHSWIKQDSSFYFLNGKIEKDLDAENELVYYYFTKNEDSSVIQPLIDKIRAEKKDSLSAQILIDRVNSYSLTASEKIHLTVLAYRLESILEEMTIDSCTIALEDWQLDESLKEYHPYAYLLNDIIYLYQKEMSN
jgi:hypothetical protein